MNKIYMNKNNFNFNHRITLQKEIETIDSNGSVNSRFENIAEVWANIEPIGSYQQFSRIKEEMETTHIVEVRYTQTFKECKKMLFGNREFFVISFYSPHEKNNTIVFNVKERL